MYPRSIVSVVAASLVLLGNAPALAEATPVCGEPVTGDVTLTADLPCDVVILASNVTLDIDGYTIEGKVSVGSHFAETRVRNATVKGGSIQEGLDFWGGGSAVDLIVDGDVYVYPSGGARISRSTISGDMQALDTGMTLLDNTIRGDVYSAEGSREGIRGNHINGRLSLPRTDYTVIGNTIEGGGLFVGASSEVLNNTVIDSSIGIHATDFDFSFGSGDPSELRGNTIGNSDVGILINGVARSLADLRVEGNTVRNSRSYGILATVNVPADGAAIQGNKVIRSGLDGIKVESALGYLSEITMSDNNVVNADGLGVNADGVIDGGGNHAVAIRDRRQCIGVLCTPSRGRR